MNKQYRKNISGLFFYNKEMKNNKPNKTYCNICDKDNCNYKRHAISLQHQKHVSAEMPSHNVKKERKSYECIICNKKYYNFKTYE